MSKTPLFAAALALLAGSAAIRPMFDVLPTRGEIRIPKHKAKGAPPPPNPKAERRKMLKVRAMQERKRRSRGRHPMTSTSELQAYVDACSGPGITLYDGHPAVLIAKDAEG